MGVFKSNSIFNPVNQLNKIGNAEDSVFGSSARIFDPGAYAFSDNGHVSGQGLTQPGGALNTMLDPADFFGGQRQGAAIQANNFNPNAPGSIFANQQSQQGPFINPLTRMRAGYTGAPTPGNPYGMPIQQPNTQQPQPVMSGQLGDTQNNLRMSIGRLLGGRS